MCPGILSSCRMLIVVVFIHAASFGLIPANAEDGAQKRPGPNTRVVKRILEDPIPFGQAHGIHLEVNTFAVKIPGLLMVFDYANDEPAPQWNPFTEKMRKHYDRSLLTGVIDPEEIKEETVVFFFSHDHPGELFLKVLGWKDEIKRNYYIVTEEMYKKYQVKIEEAKVTDRVKVARPNHAFRIKNCVIRTLPPQDCSANTLCPGVEFLVETTNGVNIYHAGAKGCLRCVDTRIMDNQKKLNDTSGVMSKDTQKMIFRDGKLVSTDDRDTAEGVGLIAEDTGVRNIGFAIYSTPEVPSGYMQVWSTAMPRFIGLDCRASGFGRIAANIQELSDLHNREKKDDFTEQDRFASSISEPDGIHLSMNEIHQHACERDLGVYKLLDANKEVLSALENITQRLCQETAGNVNAYKNYDLSWYGLQGDEARMRGEAPGYFYGYGVATGFGIHSRMSQKIFDDYNSQVEGGLD